jgi:murein DD-endopeptidase MepM/ murein hydrolase activator NlpD
MRNRLFSIAPFAFAAFFGGCLVLTQPAHAAVSDNVDQLNSQIKDKQGRVKDLDGMIKSYQDRIEAARASSTSLQAQLNLLDDQIQTKQLGIERARAQMDALTLEIQVVDANIGSQEARIQKQKDLLARLVRDVNQSDDVSPFDVLLTKSSLSEFFAQMEEVKRLQSDLGGALQHVKDVKVDLEAQRAAKKAKQQSLDDERRSLRSDQLALEAERNFKTSLVSETQNQEQGFQRVVYELKQQQQSTSSDISDLETKLKEQLNSADEALARGDALFNWPVDPSRGITAIFHDPTYPFRYLFEHPGTDIRASVGTPVKAAAGGYVAWNKSGRMYGNYTMLVHPGGFATVYAHLSKFLAKPDTYVQRQDTIGMSGGRPGDPGAGLSTGPHLHFEVREDGIPVDAENYLPSVPNDDYDQYDIYKKLKVR